jgi:hypothetical protein
MVLRFAVIRNKKRMKVPDKETLQECISELDPHFPITVLKKCTRSELMEIVKLKLKNKKIVNHIKELEEMIKSLEKQKKNHHP